MLVSRIFRAGSEPKNRALLYKGFRKPKSGARKIKTLTAYWLSCGLLVVDKGQQATSLKFLLWP